MGPQSQVKVHGWKDVQNQLGAVSKGEKKEKMKKRGAIEGGPNFWFKTNLSHVQMKQLRLWLWLLATTTTWENQTYHCSRHSHYYRSNQFRRSQRKAYIANTADIFGVMFAGQYFDQEALAALDDYAVDMAGSFRVNVRFLFDLLASPLMRAQLAD